MGVLPSPSRAVVIVIPVDIYPVGCLRERCVWINARGDSIRMIEFKQNAEGPTS